MQLNQVSHLCIAYALGGNYLNEGYCDMYVPERKLKTTIEPFQGVQKQCLQILRITLFGVDFSLYLTILHIKES